MTTTRRKPHQHAPTAKHDDIVLIGGPLDGQQFRVRRTSKAQLHLRDNSNKVLSVYAGDTSTGQLEHVRSHDAPSKRRVPPGPQVAPTRCSDCSQ